MKLLLAIFAVLAFGTSAAAQTSPAQPVVLENETILRVQGQGVVEVPPEVMEVEIGVVTDGETANAALATNSRRMETLLAEIRALGIPSQDMETADLEVEPRYADRESDEIVGWRATNTLRVRTTELDRAGEIVAALFAAGGNNIRTPTFGLTGNSEIEATRQAELKALLEGVAQAEAVAAALGMRVSRLLLVSDGNVRFSSYGSSVVITGSRIQQPVVPVEPADVEVTATYNLEFTLIGD